MPLFRDAGLADIEVEPIVDTDDGRGGREWLNFLKSRAQNALAADVVTTREAAEWFGAIEAAAEHGRYLLRRHPVRRLGDGAVNDASTRPAEGGRLADNIVHFARVLRRAGLPVGPASVIDAIRAVEVAGVDTREDFYWTLHAIFVKRRDQQAVFAEAFRLFWRSRQFLEKMLSSFLETVGTPEPRKRPAAAARVAEAMAEERKRPCAAEARGSRDRGAADRLRARGAADARLRADDRGRDRRGRAADRPARAQRRSRADTAR